MKNCSDEEFEASSIIENDKGREKRKKRNALNRFQGYRGITRHLTMDERRGEEEMKRTERELFGEPPRHARVSYPRVDDIRPVCHHFLHSTR